MLQGVMPIVVTPFDESGRLDEEGLRKVVHYELEEEIHGIGVGGFASEAYKLTDQERMRCAEIVAEAVGGRVPLIIGMAPGSTEAASRQAEYYGRFAPAALMVLPPCTMNTSQDALIDHYVSLAAASGGPLMVQQSPHIPAYAHSPLSVESMAAIARRAGNVQYFKIEGAGSVDRMKALRQLAGDSVTLFGGGGGITWPSELLAGAAGLIPGCGFNEIFLKVWRSWNSGNQDEAIRTLEHIQPLVDAVSGSGHEFSVHARKFLLKRAGIIEHATVRHPTVVAHDRDLEKIGELADTFNLRISRPRLSPR